MAAAAPRDAPMSCLPSGSMSNTLYRMLCWAVGMRTGTHSSSLNCGDISLRLDVPLMEHVRVRRGLLPPNSTMTDASVPLDCIT